MRLMKMENLFRGMIHELPKMAQALIHQNQVSIKLSILLKVK